MVIIKRIRPLSLAKIFGLGYFAVGFLISFAIFVYYIAGVVSHGLLQREVIDFLAFNSFLSLLFALAGAFLSGSGGFIQGFLLAVIYNFLAGSIGGAELDILPEEEEKERRLRERWSASYTAIKEDLVKKQLKRKNKN